LAQRGQRCEILCVTNGCTDQTPAIAANIFEGQSNHHPWKSTFTVRVVNVPERGKTNAWNLFVHSQSARTAGVLFLMDGDIVIREPNTIWNMYTALLNHPGAAIAIDQPLKDLALKARKSLRDRLSLATSRMTQTSAGQLTGQLYGIRAAVARNIYLPRDLLVEDGFIKIIVCTDFLTRPTANERIVRAERAAHVFQAYTSVRDVLRNQRRQMIAQTITHLLV